MRQLVWMLAVAGSLLMAVGVVYTFWNIWKNAIALLKPLGAIMILGGVLVLGAGLAIFSSLKMAGN